MRAWIWLMMALLGGLLYLLVAGDGGLLNLWDQAGEVQRLREENEKLAERNRILSETLEMWRAGTEWIEDLAREHLGMVGEDEKFHRFVGPEVGEGPPEPVASAPVPETP